MALIRILLFVALIISVVLVVMMYPAQLFQLLAAAVIILSTASTLVFFGFVIRAAFRGVNERSQTRRVQVGQMQVRPAAPVPDETAAPPLTPAKPS